MPQNRDRVFIVSIRKDIDDGTFEFPKPLALKLKLKDMLEKEVDEKYYLSEKMIKYIIANNEKWTGNNNQSSINKTIASTINTSEGARRCDASNYICSKLPDDYDLKMHIHNNTKKGYLEAHEGDSVNLSDTTSKYRRGRVGKEVSQTIQTSASMGVVVKSLFTETQSKMITKDGNVKRYIGSDVVDEFKEGQVADISFPNGYNKANRVFDICPSINRTTTQSSFITKTEGVVVNNCFPLNHNVQGLRIRKLTPKECFRLMGFDDECVDLLIKNGISNTQLYKQAGNSIVVNVLVEIFKKLYKGE